MTWRALAAVWVGLAAGCENPPGSTLDAIRHSGLRAGFAVEPPYALVDAAGEITGEAPEVLRQAAARLGVDEIQWFPYEFPELIPALLDGRIDVIAAGLFITAERRERVRFSRPTVCVRPALVTRTGDAPSPYSTELPIAVLDGSVEHAALGPGWAGGTAFLTVPNLATGIEAVRAGSVAAMAVSGPTARRVAAGHGGLVVKDDELPTSLVEGATGCAAFAFRPADHALADAFDRALDAFIGSPDHLDLLRSFGFLPDELP